MNVDIEIVTRQLGERLQAEEGLRAYVLLDPMLYEPLEDELLENERCVATTVPIERPGLDQDQKPRLIAWRPQAVGVLQASVRAAWDEQADPAREIGKGFALGGWLLSSEPADVVARHLAKCMWITRSGEGRRYLRLADRRIFQWMWRVWGAQERRELLGPIAAWWTFDRCGTLIEHLLPDDGNGIGRKVERPPFALAPAHWARADQCELAQHLIRGWQRVQKRLPSDYLAQVENAMDTARALGLSEPLEIVFVGAYVLQIHPRLGDHPRVRELVAEARRGSTPLGDALASIPDPEGWDLIRLELEQKFSQSRLAGETPHAANLN